MSAYHFRLTQFKPTSTKITFPKSIEEYSVAVFFCYDLFPKSVGRGAVLTHVHYEVKFWKIVVREKKLGIDP